MSDNVKVFNDTTYDIGVKCLNGIEFNIRPGTSLYMKRDDVEYNISLAPSLFRAPKQLRIEDEAINQDANLDYGATDVTANEAEIEKKLKGTAASIRKWVEPITQAHVLEKIYQMAMSMDLQNSKIKVLKEKMPERFWGDED